MKRHSATEGTEDTEKGKMADDLTERIIAAAIEVHRVLGPGLLESVYEAILARELTDRGLKVERQISIPIVWRGMRFDEGFLADIIAEGKVILELKSVE